MRFTHTPRSVPWQRFVRDLKLAMFVGLHAMNFMSDETFVHTNFLVYGLDMLTRRQI